MNSFSSYRRHLYALLAVYILTGCQENTSKAVDNTKSIGIRETGGNSSLDKSPLDMAYYPVDYPKLKMTGSAKDLLIARIIYSRPSVDERQIFGTLLKYGKPWRLGANEATEIEFFQEVNIQDKHIGIGRYVLYCKPYESKWRLILNNDLHTWGLKIDSTKDLYYFDMPVIHLAAPKEVFTMEFNKTQNGADLIVSWDSVKIQLPITFSTNQP